MKKIALIQSHCNTDEKINLLKNNIKILSEIGLDILLFTHIPLPSEIINTVKYYILDSTNPILWEERRQIYWWSDNQIKLETIVPDYGWTVYNQIIKSYNFVRNEEYDLYFIICYDLIIDEFIENIINNNKIGKFKHIRPKNLNNLDEGYDVVFDTSLIFLSLNKLDLEIIVNDCDKLEYSKNPQWIAEKYLEIILDRNNIQIESIGSVKDAIYESKSVFNQSRNTNYEIFVDNKFLLRFRYIKKNKSVNHIIIINEKIFKINEDVFVYDQPVDKLYLFGIFINESYTNLIELAKNNINKINKITFLKN